jgi:hypothetical protein
LVHRLALRAQFFLLPDQVFFCTPTPAAAAVLFLAVAVLSIPLGFLSANLLLWTVPAVREARAGRSFAIANAEVLKFTAIASLLLLPTCAAAVSSKVCLSDTHIYYRPHPFSALQAYDTSRIAEVLPRCRPGNRGGWNIGLNLVMSDGHTLDLAVVAPWFTASSAMILASLRGLPSDSTQIESGCPNRLRQLISPLSRLSPTLDLHPTF